MKRTLTEIRDGIIGSQETPPEAHVRCAKNLSLVRFVINGFPRHRTRVLPWEDLLQEGYLGLMRASIHYDPTRPVSFFTFGCTCIRNRLCLALKAAKRARLVVPETDVNTDGEMTGIIAHAVDDDRPVCSFHNQEVRERLNRLMTRLTPREQRIITLHWGLDGAEPVTQRVIGAELGITAIRVGQVEKNAMEALRGKKVPLENWIRRK